MSGWVSGVLLPLLEDAMFKLVSPVPYLFLHTFCRAEVEMLEVRQQYAIICD